MLGNNADKIDCYTPVFLYQFCILIDDHTIILFHTIYIWCVFLNKYRIFQEININIQRDYIHDLDYYIHLPSFCDIVYI